MRYGYIPNWGRKIINLRPSWATEINQKEKGKEEKEEEGNEGGKEDRWVGGSTHL